VKPQLADQYQFESRTGKRFTPSETAKPSFVRHLDAWIAESLSVTRVARWET
jgi:hypothetical protein